MDRRPILRIALVLSAALFAGPMLAGPLRAQPRWPDERQAGPFLCHADFGLDEQQPLLAELADLQQDLTKVLGAAQPRESVHLFLFQAKPTYQAYIQQYFPKVPYRRALFIKARGPGMVFAYRGDDFQIDVRHESTHALLHAWLKSVPLWLDEGLAEYFEVPHDQRAGRHPHLAATRALIRSGELPRLEALEELDAISDMGRDEYRDAWAWVHFALHGPPEATDELTRHLADLAAGTDPGPFSTRLRRRLPDLNRRVVEHFR
ncbi:MAG: DUF1570 domain-containing protein [Planctomycetaceae bacterium]|nr:DUF1570 domain-containing protein [Planctomycetaceae bacterium]